MPLTNPISVTIQGETAILSDSEIKASPSGAVTLLAAQGANKIIVPHVAYFRSKIVAPYTNIAPGDAGDNTAMMNLAWGVDNILASSLIPNHAGDGFGSVTDLLTNDAANAFVILAQAFIPSQGALAYFTALSEIANLPLTLNVQNVISGQPANFGGGDVGNKLLIRYSYEIVDISDLL